MQNDTLDRGIELLEQGLRELINARTNRLGSTEDFEPVLESIREALRLFQSLRDAGEKGKPS